MPHVSDKFFPSVDGARAALRLRARTSEADEAWDVDNDEDQVLQGVVDGESWRANVSFPGERNNKVGGFGTL